MTALVRRTRHFAVAIVVTGAAVLGFGAGCDGREKAPETAATPPAPSGHDRMIAALRAAMDRAPDENDFLITTRLRDAKKVLAGLPAGAPPAERVKALQDVAFESLRYGDADASIENFLAARALLPQLGPDADPEVPLEISYRLGVACMRLGETDNCCERPTAESCIIPIRGGGVHAEQRGSKEAMEHFRDVLRLAKPGSNYALRARWLLNIAAMTLGEWPQGLTESERIPQSAFDSGAEFPRFENVAAKLGVDNQNLAGGVIIDDLDGDGLLDILTSSSDPRVSLHFLHNDGKGRFEDRTKAAGVEGQLGGLSMVDADYDNDGDLDVYVMRGGWLTGAGGRVPSSLLRNDGKGRFTDVTYDAGLGIVCFPTSAAAWGDTDLDGDLDLYVGSEMKEGNPISNQFFRNNGDGTFTNLTRKAGLENMQFCKAVAFGDYDNDRRPDIYASNCGGPNRLFHNNGDGTFTDVAPQLGVDKPLASFGAFFFDVDNDGALDIYSTAYDGSTGQLARFAASVMGVPPDKEVETQKLYRNDGHGRFKDVSKEFGLDRVIVPMGNNFGDLNNDGWLDFYLGTGYPDYEALMPNVMYLNQEGKRFADVTWAGGFGHLQKGHAIAFADIDGDGDTDVFEEMGGALPGDAFFNALYRNPGFGNHWLTVQLVGHRSNRCAIGARIRADIVEGDRRRSVHREVNTGGAFGCNPLRQTLGLGKATRVERLEVFWPATGLTQVFKDLPVDGSIRIVEDKDAYEPVR